MRFPKTLVLACVIAGCLSASGQDDLSNANRVLAESVHLLRQSADSDVDLVLKAVAEAYSGSGYKNNPAAEAVRSRLGSEGERLKRDCTAVLREMSSKPGSSGAVIVHLSKAQMMSVKIYRWIRSATEMADLAHATSGRSNAETGEYFTNLIQTHEALQDVIGAKIQTIAADTGTK